MQLVETIPVQLMLSFFVKVPEFYLKLMRGELAGRKINSSAGIFESVCLSVCLFVCSRHNSKANDPKVFKLGVGNDLGITYSRSGRPTVLGFKGQRSMSKGQ